MWLQHGGEARGGCWRVCVGPVGHGMALGFESPCCGEPLENFKHGSDVILCCLSDQENTSWGCYGGLDEGSGNVVEKQSFRTCAVF